MNRQFQSKNLKFVAVMAILSAFLITPGITFADVLQISPPLITVAPSNLGNDELWYIGGTSQVPKSDIVIFLQNAFGETFSFVTKSNEKGEWFYAHDSFLKEGQYKSWAQLKIGDSLSPPGPEVVFNIVSTAFRIGSLRLSYSGIYAILALIMFLISIGGLVFFVYHFRFYHKKNAQLRKEILEAEEEVRTGFALLQKDIKEELGAIARYKQARKLNVQQSQREEKLLADLDFVQNHILKEISDIKPVS